MVNTVVEDGPHKVFIGGIPGYLQEEQVRVAQGAGAVACCVGVGAGASRGCRGLAHVLVRGCTGGEGCWFVDDTRPGAAAHLGVFGQVEVPLAPLPYGARTLYRCAILALPL